jgi:hypothetical protein
MMNKEHDITSHSSFQKLEQHLVLLVWLNGHFGYDNNRDLLADMKEANGRTLRWIHTSFQQRHIMTFTRNMTTGHGTGKYLPMRISFPGA